MTDKATAGTPAPELPALAQAARTFMASMKDEKLPNGAVRDSMDEKYTKLKGLSVVLRGIGEFIDSKQDLVSVDANRTLVARLKGEDGNNLAFMMFDIASNPDDLMARREELRKALIVNGESIFDRIR